MAPHASSVQGSHPPLPTGSPPTVKIHPSTKVPYVAFTLGQYCLISTEPHLPHVLMEKGDMTLGEFDQHLKGRADFIKGMKKDSSAERKVRVAEQRQRWQNWGGSGHWLLPHRWRVEEPCVHDQNGGRCWGLLMSEGDPEITGGEDRGLLKAVWAFLLSDLCANNLQ